MFARPNVYVGFEKKTLMFARNVGPEYYKNTNFYEDFAFSLH